MSARARLAAAAPWLVVALFVLAFAGVGCSTGWARLAALRTVEPYALAAHDQLLYTFARTGHFAQTIHTGYDDAWTWSGHRAATLPLVGQLYRLCPSPFWLVTLLIGAVALGALPAAGLGRKAFGGPWGAVAGALLYLGCPATLCLALQDYQDLVFALPCLMVALWGLRTRAHPAAVALCALLGCLPREECAPAVALCALVTFDPAWPRPWRRWLRNLALAGGVALAWGLGLALLFPVRAQAHDMPLLAALSGLFDPGQRRELFGLPFLWGFYALCWMPLGLLGLLAPLSALPGLALLLLHMTVPYGHGVDRAWGGHAHHLAPALPFLLAAAILGAGRLWRGLGHARLGRLGSRGRWLLAVGLLGYAAWWDLSWARGFNLVIRPWPAWPQRWHPAWSLLAALPPEAVPIVPVEAAPAASTRLRAYTWAESLQDKAPGQGLAAGTHLLVHRDDAEVLGWGRAMPGARVLAEAEPFLLLTWDPGAADPSMAAWGGHLPHPMGAVVFQLGGETLPPGVAPPPRRREPELPFKPPPERR